MRIFDLVGYAKLTKMSPDFSTEQFVIDELMKDEPSGDFIGLSSIKVGLENLSNTAEINITLSIAGKFVSNQSILNDIFSLQNNWKLEFGWNDVNNTVNDNNLTIRRMKLADWNIEYDSVIRGYSVSMKFFPVPFLVLSNIPLRLCKVALQKIKNEDKDVLSIGYVLNELLLDSKRVMREFKKIEEGEFDNKNQQTTVIRRENDKFRTAEPSQTRTRDTDFERDYKRIEISKGDGKFIEKNEVTDLSIKHDVDVELVKIHEYIQVGSEKDVPDPKEIRHTFFAKSDSNADDIYRSFMFKPMADLSTIKNLKSVIDYELNFSVYSFIEDLLLKNGYTINIIPNMFGSDGLPIVRITQSSVAKFDDKSFSEYEFIGIYNAVEGMPMLATDRESFNAIYGKKGPIYNQHVTPSVRTFRNRIQFNSLHRSNIISSISAGSKVGKSSVYTAIAEDQLNDPSGENEIDSDPTNTIIKNNIFDIEKTTAKTISIETIGYPELIIGDNIFVEFFGDLFTGTYKILGITHNFSQEAFTTSLECVMIKKGLEEFDSKLRQGDGIVPIVESIPWYVKFLIETGIAEKTHLLGRPQF